MPIILQQNAASPVVNSADPSQVRADVSTVYDRPIPNKTRGFRVNQATAATVTLNLFDNFGNPVDLTQYGIVNTPGSTTTQVQLALREFVGLGACQANLVNATIANAAVGQVSFSLAGSSAVPGVYNAEAGVFDTASPTPNLLFSNRLYLIVESGLFGQGATTTSGPPTTDEIRLAIRDQPELNLLLDTNAYDVAEMALALGNTVRWFNAMLPPVGSWDTTTFPFEWRAYWAMGACAQLLETAAAWFRANAQAVQAGGVQVNDLGREGPYMQAAALLKQQFAEWAKLTKVSINAAQGFGISGGWYRH